jgi:hypothetical protein
MTPVPDRSSRAAAANAPGSYASSALIQAMISPRARRRALLSAWLWPWSGSLTQVTSGWRRRIARVWSVEQLS